MEIGTFDKIDTFVSDANLTVELKDRDLDLIPRVGPAVLIVNRIYGSIEPILMAHVLKEIRPAFTVFSEQLGKFEKELDSIFGIDFRDETDQILKALKNELEKKRLVVLFPGRRKELTSLFYRKRQDTRWNKRILEVIYQLNTLIIPVFLGNPSNQKALPSKISVLPSKFSFDQSARQITKLNNRERTILVKVGKPLNHNQSFQNAAEYGRYLRARLFALDTSVEVNSFFRKRGNALQSLSPSEIDPCVDSIIVETELNHLEDTSLLAEKGEFCVFLASAGRIPNTIKEIGRLREMTFREAGEGTGFSADIDEYDLYYHQLILWDSANKKIAGGYRIGFGGDIMARYGKRGMYVNSLFKIKSGFSSTLEKSIELGRSYVVPDYQKARLPLFLMWKGILSVLLKHPEYRFLIGPVSISNDYSSLSRQLIVSYIKNFFWDENFAQFVKPRNKFKAIARQEDILSLMKGVNDEAKTLEKVISELEPVNTKVPILIKKYIKQNAKIIGFSVDRNFSDALDGLMILDIQNLPEESISNLKEGLSET